jgi:C1q domain
MTRGTAVRGLFTAIAIAIGATSASAQVFGTFSWQMQPYCNQVTLTLTSVTGNFTLDGSDDMCGTAKKGSATGIGVFNPDGTVGLNFTIVTPGGQAVHVAASVSPANGQGTWTDDQGHSGTFAFFGNSPGLPALPTGTHFRIANLSGTLAVGAGTTIVNTWTTPPAQNVGGGTYDAATGAYRVPVAGVYLVTTTVRWQAFASAAGYRCLIVTTGTQNRALSCEAPSTTATFQIQPLSTVVTLNAGDEVSIRALQASGGAATIGASSGDNSMFTVTRLQ